MRSLVFCASPVYPFVAVLDHHLKEHRALNHSSLGMTVVTDDKLLSKFFLLLCSNFPACRVPVGGQWIAKNDQNIIKMEISTGLVRTTLWGKMLVAFEWRGLFKAFLRSWSSYSSPSSVFRAMVK